MKTLLPLLLISTLALQCPAVATADTTAPIVSPAPIASPVPTKTKKDQSLTWLLVGSAVVLGVLLLTDHAPGGYQDHVLEHTRSGSPGKSGQLKSVPMQVDRV